MSKTRPFIPPPKFTPPVTPLAEGLTRELPNAAETQKAAELAEAAVRTPIEAARPAVELAVVRPPARAASWRVHADHVEFVNPTIDFPEAIWLKHVFPHQQVKNGRLEPARAVVAHGMILIEEYGLALSCEHASIRTVIKETP